MIFSVNGRIGHGKGCVMTYLAERQAAKGRRVFCNYPTEDPRIELITTWEQVCDLENCDVFLDEMHLWFPARDWKNLGKPDDMLRWSQSRHDGLNIYWCSQDPSQVDVQIRDVFTHFVYSVTRLWGPDDDGELTRLERVMCALGRALGISHVIGATVVVNKFVASEFKTASKRVACGRFFLNLCSMWGRYDTHYIIGFRNGEGAREGRGRLSSLRDSGAALPCGLSSDSYDRMRYVDPHFPQIVRLLPDVGAAIAERNRNDKVADKGSALGERERLGRGGWIPGGGTPKGNGVSVGVAHTARGGRRAVKG